MYLFETMKSVFSQTSASLALSIHNHRCRLMERGQCVGWRQNSLVMELTLQIRMLDREIYILLELRYTKYIPAKSLAL